MSDEFQYIADELKRLQAIATDSDVPMLAVAFSPEEIAMSFNFPESTTPQNAWLARALLRPDAFPSTELYRAAHMLISAGLNRQTEEVTEAAALLEQAAEGLNNE